MVSFAINQPTMKFFVVPAIAILLFVGAGCASSSDTTNGNSLLNTPSNTTETVNESVINRNTPAPIVEEPVSENCDIKGNISSEGEKIYHVPGGQYYSKTIITESKGERWFCSEADAKAAGWRKSLR